MAKVFFILLLCMASVNVAADEKKGILLPHGFVTYSRGEAHDRVLCRAEIAPGMSFDQIHATERVIVEKGPYGGDITSQISFDGKWVAFARSLKGTNGGSGGNNYADFGKWDVYIARVDGELPVEPIRIAHGFFPSWGEDSASGGDKTLYFSVDEKRAVHKVRINDKGEIIEAESEVGTVPADGYEGFMFAAPNGQFVAYRKSGAVYTYWFEGPNKGKAILMSGGCHPHVTANSQWVYHANRKAVRADGSVRGAAGAGGLYHYGSSNDMNWFVTRTEGDNTIINRGRESWLCTLYATDEIFDTEKAVKISDQAGFIDIHVYDDRASRKAAKNNHALHNAISDGRLRAVMSSKNYTPLSKEQLASLPVSERGEIFVWENDAADSRIMDVKGNFLRSCRMVPYGLAFLGRNGRIHVDGGSFRVEDKETASAMAESVRATNQFAIELQFVAFSTDVSGPARIISSSIDASRRNWTIGQEKDMLVLRLRTSENGNNGTNAVIELGKIESGKPYHLIISYTPGNTVWSLNGQIGYSSAVGGDLSNWEEMPIVCGDELSGGRIWRGEIQGIYCTAHAISPDRMKARYKSSRKGIATLMPEKSYAVKAVVIENSQDPTVEQIRDQGYTRCLTTRHMRVISSDNPALKQGDEFILKEWTVLGLKKINQRKQGDECTMLLYDAAHHDELLNEYTVEGLSVFDLPMYYNQQL